MPGWADYRMPISGLYQTGATTAPGGSVTGMPGRNAAMVMLKDFGTSIEEVVKVYEQESVRSLSCERSFHKVGHQPFHNA